MVKEYLEKTRDMFIEERVQQQELILQIHNKCKENIHMIQLLEDNNDPNFESFTPREVNGFNKQKIQALQEEQKELIEQINEARKKASIIDMKIDEINSVIKVATENETTTCKQNISEELDNDMKSALLETIERERQRIARDLHDSTVQNLTSLVHKTELCLKIVDIDPIRCKLELSTMGKALREVINEARKLIYDLRPMSFDDIGFDITVERAIDKFRQMTTKNFSYKVEGEAFYINPIIALTLLRIIQECCSNAVKHADAEQIDVSIAYLENEIQIQVKDNGKGFDIKKIPVSSRNDNSGNGLSMMKERVYMLSGDITIESNLGEGSCINVRVPINKEER